MNLIDLPASKCTNAVGKETGERSRVNEKGALFMTALVGQSLIVASWHVGGASGDNRRGLRVLVHNVVPRSLLVWRCVDRKVRSSVLSGVCLLSKSAVTTIGDQTKTV